MDIVSSLTVWLDKNPTWLYVGAGFIGGLITPGCLKVTLFIFNKLGMVIIQLKLVPQPVLRKIFSQNRMARKVDIRVGSSRGESLIIELCEHSRGRVWLQISNHLPFDIEFEELIARVYYDGVQINITLNESFKIDKYSIVDDLVLKCELSKEQAQHFSRKEGRFLAIEITGRYKSRFNYIEVNTGHLVDYHIRDLRMGRFRA